MKSLLAALLLLVPSALPATAQPTATYQDRPKIIVSGEAVVEAMPNKIVITFGIETKNRDISLAKQKNDEILKKALAAVKACGVPENNVQTVQLSIRPLERSTQQKAYQQPAPSAPAADVADTGAAIVYLVETSLQVTLSDTRKIEELIGAVLQTGVTQLYGTDTQTSEFRKYREQAREAALRAAREKAEKMAAVLGQLVGEPLEISEISEGWSPDSPFASPSQNAYPALMANFTPLAVAASETTAPSTSTIPLGKLAIRATVRVVFALKK
jgi:hypothetical protein